MKNKHFINTAILTLCLSLGLISCKKEADNIGENTGTTGIRKKIDYNGLSSSTPYKSLFLDDNGDTVVDLSNGNVRYKMFMAINTYLGSAAKEGKTLDAQVLKNMFSNSNNPFSDISSLNITGAELNGSGLQLREITASSPTAEQEIARLRLENLFTEMANTSVFVTDSAYPGKPGKLGSYLLDAKGIENAQIIQKTLIGAMQLDYICNVLLDEGLKADNKTIISGKKYTQLEQNWDQAYGLLTLNPVYLLGSTDGTKGSPESFLGSYVWEFNKAAYAKIYPAFLKGRAAIANNDLKEVQIQAIFIRTEMERAIASAAAGYLNKWKTGTTDAARAHAISEGLGFIYSLRFCNLNHADAIFSDQLLKDLIQSDNGFWDLTTTKINAAADTITNKFKL